VLWLSRISRARWIQVSLHVADVAKPAFRVALETPAQHAPQRRGRGRGETVPLDIARAHRGQRVSHGVARAKDLAHAALTDGCGDFVDAAGTRAERQVDGLYGRGTPPLHQCTR
jgi:hypothetical protein